MKIKIQGVLKLVTQKSPELGATIRSGAFQNMCLVLTFLFNPPDGSAELLRNPASLHGVIYRCGALTVLVKR